MRSQHSMLFKILLFCAGIISAAVLLGMGFSEARSNRTAGLSAPTPEFQIAVKKAYAENTAGLLALRLPRGPVEPDTKAQDPDFGGFPMSHITLVSDTLRSLLPEQAQKHFNLHILERQTLVPGITQTRVKLNTFMTLPGTEMAGVAPILEAWHQPQAGLKWVSLRVDRQNAQAVEINGEALLLAADLR